MSCNGLFVNITGSETENESRELGSVVLFDWPLDLSISRESVPFFNYVVLEFLSVL